MLSAKITPKNPLPLAALMLSWGLLSGQLSNDGELAILPNTQMGVQGFFSNSNTAVVINDGEAQFNGDFRNDGDFTFLDPTANSLTRFGGNQVQRILGTSLIELTNLELDNSTAGNAFELTADLSITGQLNFIAGILSTRGHGGSVSFEALASHTNSSNYSAINGNVTKTGANAFAFPLIEKGVYKRIAISAPGEADAIFSADYQAENSNPNYPHSQREATLDIIDDKEFWLVDRLQGTATVVITLSLDDDITPPELLFEPSLLHIARWDTTQQQWVDEGGLLSTDNLSVTTVAAVDNYGIFTLARSRPAFDAPGEMIINNMVSPNGNGKNDFLLIEGIQRYPENTLQVFNRWGSLVYQTTGYNETDNVFRGQNNSGPSIGKDSKLPSGTYFYVLRYNKPEGETTQSIKKVGYVYIVED